jgi:hypothetical protein
MAASARRRQGLAGTLERAAMAPAEDLQPGMADGKEEVRVNSTIRSSGMGLRGFALSQKLDLRA